MLTVNTGIIDANDIRLLCRTVRRRCLARDHRARPSRHQPTKEKRRKRSRMNLKYNNNNNKRRKRPYQQSEFADGDKFCFDLLSHLDGTNENRRKWRTIQWVWRLTRRYRWTTKRRCRTVRLERHTHTLSTRSLRHVNCCFSLSVPLFFFLFFCMYAWSNSVSIGYLLK